MSTVNTDGLSIEEFSLLVWENKLNLKIELTNDRKDIKIWLDDKGYDPYYVFQGLLRIATDKATKDEKGKQVPTGEALLIFAQVKAEILSLVSGINKAAEMYSLGKRDYSNFLLHFDSFIDWAKYELDAKLHDSQIQTNELSKITNVYIAIFTGLGGLYALLQLLTTLIPDHVKNRNHFIYFAMAFATVVGIIGYLRISRINKQSKRQ